MNKSLIFLLAVAGGSLIAAFLIFSSMRVSDTTEQLLQLSQNKSSPYISEFTVETKDARVNAIAVDDDGIVWFVENEVNRLASFDPVQQIFREYNIPDEIGFVWSILTEKSNEIWFIDSENDNLWKFDITNNNFRSYNLPSKDSFPFQMALDQDGNIWFTEFSALNKTGDKIGMFDAKTERFVEYRTPTPESGPIGIAFDSSGNIWFTELSKIGVFFPSNSSFKEYDFPKPVIPPTGIAIDNYNTVWFTQHGGNKIAKFIPYNDTLIEYSTLSLRKDYPATLPYWIKLDRHGNLWFNEHTGNRIAKFIPSSETLIEYHIPSKEIVDALTFTLDKDGNVWFTELTGNKIGFVNASFPVAFTVDAFPKQVTVHAGETSEIKLTVKPTSASYSSKISLIATSTMTPLGRFMNATALLIPSSLNLEDGHVETALRIQTEPTLLAGKYKVSVGATDGFVSYLTTIDLIVLGK